MNLLHWLYSWKIKLHDRLLWFTKKASEKCDLHLENKNLEMQYSYLRQWWLENWPQHWESGLLWTNSRWRLPRGLRTGTLKHTDSTRWPTTYLSRKVHTPGGTTTKVNTSHTPISTDSQHGFLSHVYDHLENKYFLFLWLH